MRKYYLIDANIAASYYLKRCSKNGKVSTRVDAIVDYIRDNPTEHFIYIPNFCIAETVSAFIKHTFAGWNPHLKGRKPIDSRVYKRILNSLQTDIHNGKFMYHYELDRYHILGINLVAPIDHYFQISRKSKKNKGRRITPAGTFDQLIISMGISLAHVHGAENVVILTADKRLGEVIKKCRSNIPKKTLATLKMEIAESVCSRKFSPTLFPKHLDLGTCADIDLKNEFGAWPLKNKLPKKLRPFTFSK